MNKPRHADRMPAEPYDLFIIGGGINGCGIARDAAGRGLSVGLAEMNDLASATSSSSTKLFHGGLRYLEYFEFRLVREALIEREILLKSMPHISWPMRFVLPYHESMRFETTTPLSRLLASILPWMKGRRPSWLIRLGLFMYDHLGGRKILPGTRVVNLSRDVSGGPLKEQFRHAYEYSDCWVEDSRLVVLNARDASMNGAAIMPRTRVIKAEREGKLWKIITTASQTGIQSTHYARVLVNAGGPWVESVIKQSTHTPSTDHLRLVRGSHIITRRLFDHDKCYFFQGADGRIIFAIPYEGDFTLIGTTDVDHPDPDTKPVCTEEEKFYLCNFASQYFKRTITSQDIVATFSGVRPLYNDGASEATAATRDYVLRLDVEGGIPLINIFGGKITTYRKLAESVMAKIAPFMDGIADNWTATSSLPGGDFAVHAFDDLVEAINAQYPFLPGGLARRLVRAYGTDTRLMLANVSSPADLGSDFGAGIFRPELNWAIDHEWVVSAEDFVWRRTRLGLQLTEQQISSIDDYIQSYRSAMAS